MPFIGRDWRSPGEAWVKTESLGWQRMKIIESQLHPSYHHQQNPACSWPPRSEFGHHMAAHCKENDRSVNVANSDTRSPSELRNSFSSACSSSGSGSSSSGSGSRAASKSPSPTCSPEKNMHHIYPITISSPYGQYSCCGHHFDRPGSPSMVPTTTFCDGENKLQNTQTTLSRSLSRESVLLDTTNKSHPTNKMRYNNSVPDFRDSNSPSAKDSTYRRQDGSPNNLDANNGINEANSHKSLVVPILITDECKLEDPILCDPPVPVDSTMIDDNKTPSGQQQQQQQDNQTSACCCTHHHQNGQMIYQPKEPYVRTAPHCRVSVRTREVAMYNTISEAFYRLDFCNAIHDIRRFNYICKLLHLLITQNLTSLSGCATKVLFTMLEQVAWEVSSNKRNIHVLKNLLTELKQMIQKNYCWGRPIGSSLLWQQHFDTIERISQIVDGIELAPSTSEQAQPVTFNNLPVEMVREILLRLNDYRDLVNSAQASPVMRNMVDGQYIWQRLCRYHFTHQQLEFALANSRNGMLTKPTKNTVRNLKYAKTTSADGRTSFRNPVVHNRSKSNGSSSSSNTRQQHQTNGRRNSRLKDSTGPGNAEAGTSSSSYVTRTIRIFDRERDPPSTIGSGQAKKIETSEPPTRESPKQPASDNQVHNQTRKQQQQQQDRPLNSNRSSSHEIDWERVFHQLRKKFDLKEEYADCLLLCRHCRCLFWKSFGHPCIKNDDDIASSDRYCSNLSFDHRQSCALDNVQNSRNCDAPLGRASDGQGGTRLTRGRREEQGAQDQALSRLSVAALSRNFDNRSHQSSASPPSSSPSMGGRDNLENLANSVESNLLSNRQQPAVQSDRQNQQPRHMNGNNLEASLRGRYIRMVANRRLDNGANHTGGGNNNNNNNLISRREELVPKHVAVSPQAFLKFFSL